MNLLSCTCATSAGGVQPVLYETDEQMSAEQMSVHMHLDGALTPTINSGMFMLRIPPELYLANVWHMLCVARIVTKGLKHINLECVQSG